MKFTIQSKLLTGFAMVLVLTLAVSIYGLLQMNTLAGLTTKIYDHPLQVTRAVLSADANIIKIRSSMKDVSLATDSMEVKTASRTIDEYEQEVYQQLAIVDERILGEEGKTLVAETTQIFTDWKPIRDEVIGLMKRGLRNEAAAITQEKGIAHVDLLSSKMDELQDYANNKASEMYTTAAQTRNQAISITAVALLFVVVLSAGFAFALARSISNPLKFITGLADRLAVGDAKFEDENNAHLAKVRTRGDEIGDIGRAFESLTRYFSEMTALADELADGNLTVKARPKGTTDILGNAFTKMIDSLNLLVSEVAENAASLGIASQQLAATANQTGRAANQVAITIQQVAEGTTQQTINVTRSVEIVDQVSRAITGVSKGAQEQAVAVSKSTEMASQMSSALAEMVANAKTGATAADNAAATAKNGTQTVKQTIQGMHNIKAKVGLSAQKVHEMGQRSDQIGAIVETIEDIASQTNLLALNAAIEAARAGEHGKGFAVVADEVRKLAEKSATATKEIAGLIKSIQATVTDAVRAMNEGSEEVELGVTRANESEQALLKILSAAESVNLQVSKITKAADSLDHASVELVVSLEMVSAVVEENTASTEEMAAGSNEVTAAIENIASISQENSAGAEEVTAATEEMNAQAEELAAAAQSLSEMAESLQGVVAQFKLEQEGSQSSAMTANSPAEALTPTTMVTANVVSAIQSPVINGAGVHHKV